MQLTGRVRWSDALGDRKPAVVEEYAFGRRRCDTIR